MDFKFLLQGIKTCACGKTHICPIDHIKIGKGALSSLPALCDGYHRILMVSDQNTYRVCGQTVAELLGDKIAAHIRFETGGSPLIPDENAIETISCKVTDDTDLILGVGSGSGNNQCVIFIRKDNSALLFIK